MLPQLLDVGSIAAILVAGDRGIARWTQLRANRPVKEPVQYDGYGIILHDKFGHRVWTDQQIKDGMYLMTEPSTTPAPDPYAGARQMGITVPEAPAPADGKPAVTVTPEAAAGRRGLPGPGPVQTPLSGKLRGIASDVIDVIQALEAAEE